ncbi:hypothetical protein Tco_0890276 [Tanacetum coccineum]|uniref:Uncharacterized protein n=1 Tax=Tanacetum coccineum TaxID=301880 RepID=A0ABQ5C511_9ASTR
MRFHHPPELPDLAPEVPPSPDYIPALIGPPSPNSVPRPEEPEHAHPPLRLIYIIYYSPESIHRRIPRRIQLTTLTTRDDDDEEEEDREHPAPADFVPPVHRMTARISIRDEPSISLPPREELFTSSERGCVLLSPTPSLKVERVQHSCARQDRPTITRDDPYSIVREELYRFVDMVDVPPKCSTSRELDYGITGTWDDLVGAIDEIAPTTLEGVNQRVTDLSTIVEQETTIMYGIMEDAQDDRSQLRGRVNLLYRDRPIHSRLAVMVEREARMAREAWGLSMDASDYARSDVMSLHTTVVAQSALILELQSADHRRQGVIKELWASDHKRQVQLTKALELLKGLQTQMAEFQRQLGPAKGPAQPDAPGEAGSSS